MRAKAQRVKQAQALAIPAARRPEPASLPRHANDEGMFTGLVQHVGRIASVQDRPSGMRRLWLDPDGWDHQPADGASIAINGCCLTVAEQDGGRWAFDAVAETLAKTTVGRLAPGSRVNLEHAMRAGDPFGGHFVQGHVDGVGTVARVQEGEDWRLRVGIPDGLMPYATPKGSIAIAGVSLTIAELSVPERWVEIALIPTTLAETTLGGLALGEGVNLEMDMLVKSVVHTLRHFQDAT